MEEDKKCFNLTYKSEMKSLLKERCDKKQADVSMRERKRGKRKYRERESDR